MTSLTKRIITAFLTLVLLLGFAACAVGPESPSGGSTAEAATKPATAESTPGTSTAATLKIVSLNAQNADYDTSGEATIEAKYQKLADALGAKEPDLIFLQECNTVFAAEGIRARMPEASKYAVVSGEGATTMVIYNKDVFSLFNQGCQKIGEKGDENGSNYERYMVWVLLIHKELDAAMAVVPVHVDYATKACKAQINTIVAYLKENYPAVPTILAGDFNAEMGTVSATSLTTEGYLDARTTATEKINGDEKTFPEKSQIIDFVWYKRGQFFDATATKYEVITDALPTDHRPIYTEIALRK